MACCLTTGHHPLCPPLPPRPQLSLPLEPSPSFRQGFGRLNLTRAIPVSGVSPAGWRIQVRAAPPLRHTRLPPSLLALTLA
jgi:hypothetical protein